MTKLHKHTKIEKNENEPKKGQRGILCSNEIPSRCPFLSSNQTNITEDEVIKYLAVILLGDYLEECNDNNAKDNRNTQQGSNLYSSIDQGTSR
jgi:hypothetical protein